jgi:phosphohistidine phosphatase
MIEAGFRDMILYLVRHGIAVEHSAEGDEMRALTDEGRSKLEDLFDRAAKAGIKPDRILTSPYKRAAQTARIAAKLLDGPEPIETRALVPHASPREVWDEVRANQDAGELMCTSHEPLLSNTVGHLLNAPTLRIEVKKGAMIAIEFDALRGEPRGVLRWMLIPKLCQ